MTLTFFSAAAHAEAPFVALDGKCLDYSGPDYDSKVNGGRIQAWDCHSGPNQQWHWDNGRLMAKNGKCLDFSGPDYDSRSNGGRIQAWDCHGGPNQQWRGNETGSSATTRPAPYASASKVGGATLSNLVCNADGNFPDVSGQCWKCPDGYHHDNPLLLPTDGKVCKRTGENRSKNPWPCTKPGGFGPCDKSLRCYKCPDGSNHDSSKTCGDDAICRTADSSSAADKQNRTAGCAQGFFDAIDSGSCWQCPASQPVRNLTASVKSDKACMSTACGGSGERPCQVTERVPSCSAGLLEDPVKNKCVPVLSGQALCRALVSAMQNQPPPQFASLVNTMAAPLVKAIRAVDTGGKQAMTGAAKAAKSSPNLAKIISEINRIRGQVSADKIKSLFSNPDLVCGGNGSAIVNAITAAGLKPGASILAQADAFQQEQNRPLYASLNPLILAAAAASSSDKHFYLEVGFTLNGALGAGSQSSLSFVTDFRGATAALWSFGPALVSNVTAGFNAYFNFYPAVSLDDFGGDLSSFNAWNWELAMSGGEGVDLGFTFVYDQQMGVHPEQSRYLPNPQGIGFLYGLSVGLLPAEGAICANYSYLISH